MCIHHIAWWSVFPCTCCQNISICGLATNKEFFSPAVVWGFDEKAAKVLRETQHKSGRQRMGEDEEDETEEVCVCVCV